MNAEQKNSAVSSAKGLAKWFAVDVSIRIFGVEIWSYHFPPQNN